MDQNSNVFYVDNLEWCNCFPAWDATIFCALRWTLILHPRFAQPRIASVFHLWVGQNADTAYHYSFICRESGMTGEGFSNESHINQSYLGAQPESCLLESPIGRSGPIFGQCESIICCQNHRTSKCYLLVCKEPEGLKWSKTCVLDASGRCDVAILEAI